MPSKIPGKGHRIYYVRYADDFLIGINGHYDIAVKVREEVANYLEEVLKLKLNMDKTKITSATNDRATFLGAQVRAITSQTNDQPRRKGSKTDAGRKIRARIPQGHIRAFVPLERVVKKLQEQGMCKIRDFARRDVIPTRKVAWVNLEMDDIISRYNYV